MCVLLYFPLFLLTACYFKNLATFEKSREGFKKFTNLLWLVECGEGFVIKAGTQVINKRRPELHP